MSTRKPEWWLDLEMRTSEPPRAPRRPLFLAGADSAVGSIEADLADALRAAGVALVRQAGGERLDAAPDAALARIAHWLHAEGRSGKWRDELLAVTDASRQRLAVIERAAVRPLGIATFAVHLVGFSPTGSVWVQQRALDKATDPGRWDTLVGGLVAAGEDDALALERETWEEAGLRAADLGGLARADRITVRRPLREGYMIEHIAVFEAVIADGAPPSNQDGEVAGFRCLEPRELIESLASGAFTLEAGLILARCLARRGLL